MFPAVHALVLLAYAAAYGGGFPASDETLSYTVNWPTGLSLGEGRMTASHSAATKDTPDRWEFRLALDAAVPVRDVTEDVLATLTDTLTPQGVVAVCRFVDVGLDDVLRDPPRLVTVLVQARDPGNGGSVLRVSDAAGAGAVLFTADSVDPYNGKSVRASAGSLFHLPVVRHAPWRFPVGLRRRSGPATHIRRARPHRRGAWNYSGRASSSRNR